MCLVCYSPGIAIGELSMIGGPLLVAATVSIRRRLGYVDEEGSADGAGALRSHQSANAASRDAAPAAMNAAD